MKKLIPQRWKYLDVHTWPLDSLLEFRDVVGTVKTTTIDVKQKGIRIMQSYLP
jgi:hypothetical protein